MKLDRVFKKPILQIGKKNYGMAGKKEAPEVPEGLLRKCPKCGKAILAKDVKERQYTCPKCQEYFRLPARKRLEMTVDPGSFEEWKEGVKVSNPLDYPEYEEKKCELQKKTGMLEAVITGQATICGQKAAVGVMDGRFLMASMGYEVGERITRMVERATKRQIPVLLFICSGGARMQEGIISLMQMAKTAAALKRHKASGNLYISVLTDPTMGGVTASFAMLGDIILAEPGARIGFAGPRVIEQTIGGKLPEGFQKSEFLLEKGFLDGIVRREDMRETLAFLLALHSGKEDEDQGNNELPKEEKSAKEKMSREAEEAAVREESGVREEAAVREELGVREESEGRGEAGVREEAGDETEEAASGVTASSEAEATKTIPGKALQNREGEKNRHKDERKKKKEGAWSRVKLSRKKDRPVAIDYIDALFPDFFELHGDRESGEDRAILGGLADFHGIPVTVIAQAKGRTTKENVERNFGMPMPEGYRKARRLAKDAERFGRPVICLVDTPGAFCGTSAEERGQGEAIARNLAEFSDLKVPVLSIIIGEGGSGGALGMAVADEVWMLENAVYSILSPEGFASILWKDGAKAKEAAEMMKLTADDLYNMGVIEKIIREPSSYTVKTMETVTETIEDEIRKFLERQESLTAEEIRKRRYERFRKM